MLTSCRRDGPVFGPDGGWRCTTMTTASEWKGFRLMDTLRVAGRSRKRADGLRCWIGPGIDAWFGSAAEMPRIRLEVRLGVRASVFPIREFRASLPFECFSNSWHQSSYGRRCRTGLLVHEGRRAVKRMR